MTRSIIEIFNDVADTYSDNIAILTKNERLTFNELQNRSNQLANCLIQNNIQPGSPVSIYLPRSANSIIAMLAILKIGGHYIVLSTEVCTDYIEILIKQAKINVLITNEKGAAFNVPTTINLNLVSDLTNSSVQFKKPAPDPNAIAYIAFTSGTTGQPKGVVVSHKSVVNLVTKQNYFNVSSNDIFLQLSPLEFDGSVFEVWGSLLNGVTLSLMPAGYPALSEIARQIEENDISILFITTQLFNSMVDHRLESLLKVKQLFFGGEVASLSHINKVLRNNYFKYNLTNIYGPTECTTFSTYYPILADMQFTNDIPIGKPINGMEILVADENLDAVDIGETGELIIGGEGVAQKYINDPELSEVKFIQNINYPIKSKNLFRTGDIVKILPDGNLIFQGRRDRLIKIRGHRVSLEKVENEIFKFPHINTTAVAMVKTMSDTELMVAWIEPSSEIFLIDELKGCLKKQLPHHMVPNRFNITKKIPLKQNGKINYQLLIEEEERLNVR